MAIPSGHSVTDMIRAIDCWQRLFFYIFITVFYVNTFVYVACSVLSPHLSQLVKPIVTKSALL